MIARAGRLTRVAAALALLASAAARGGELIVGEVQATDAAPIAFRITGESREQVQGGSMVLGDATFTIQRVSQRGLIGAARVHEAGDGGGFTEFAVFSSSFSARTAVGEPWMVARRYLHCDRPYNSFLAVYRVNGAAAARELGPVPYPDLARDLALSDAADVYCFMSTRGSGN